METASTVKALYKASQRKIFYSQDIALNLQQKWLQFRDEFLNLQIDGETHHYYWLNPVCRAFTEDQRKYHNFYHIDKLYEFYDNVLISKGLIDVEDQYTNSNFLLALWFHDIIYDPKAKDNEERSRIVFQEYMKKNEQIQKFNKKPDENLMSPQQIQLVENIIMATVKHQIDESKFETPKDLQICKLFLDADLSVLGSLPDDYDEYAQRIWEEYSYYGWDNYCKGRVQVLQRFIEKDRLYFCDEIKNEIEERARENIKREIIRLEQGQKLYEDLE